MTEELKFYSNGVTSRTSVYLKDVEKYAEEMENQDTDPTENVDTPSGATISEENADNATDWKKRYADLQSYTDRQLAAIKAQVDAERQRHLETQQKLKEAETKPKSYPVSEQEIAEWAEQFPEFHKTLVTIVEKITDTKSEHLRAEIKHLEEQSKAVAAEKGRAELLKLHPDAFELERDPRFVAWIESARPRVRALIESSDPYEIAEGLRLFKESAGIKPKANQEKEASKAVSVKAPAQLPEGKKVWRESEIVKMHPRTFLKYEAEIDAARKEGRFEYDLS